MSDNEEILTDGASADNEGAGEEPPEPAATDPQGEQAACAAVAAAPFAAPAKPHGHMSQKTRKRLWEFVAVPLMILVASAIRTICVHTFQVANNFAPGGFTGIGTMIEYATGGKFSTGYTNIIANVPLIIISFFFLGKGFAIKSAITIGLASVGMILMNILDPGGVMRYQATEGERIFAALACGVIGGVGVALVIKAGSSNGGTDIIAALIQKKYAATGITWFIMILDGTVVLASFFVYNAGPTPIFMSFVQMFCYSFVGDTILTGFKSALKYEIITDDPTALSKELIEKLGHSVTKLDALGMYAQSKKYLLICVIYKRQLSEFNKILKKYPNTFAYVTPTSEVYGRGFGG